MTRIAAVMQSYDQLDIDDILDISVGLIKFPRGEGRTKILNIDLLNETKNRSLTYVYNDDHTCLARALVLSRGLINFKGNKITRQKWRVMYDENSQNQKKEAEELLKETGLTADESATMGAIPQFEKSMQANSVVISADHQNKVVRPKILDSKYEKVYYLYHVNNHFHSIKSPEGLLGVPYLCRSCLKPYHQKNRHRCMGICEKCKTTDCFVTDKDSPRSCRHCSVEFKSESSYNRHLEPQGKAKSVCSKFWQCQKCRRSLLL